MNDFRLQTAYQVMDGYLSLHPRADRILDLKQVGNNRNQGVSDDQNDSNVRPRRSKVPLQKQVKLISQ
jgi:hypothetical protein